MKELENLKEGERVVQYLHVENAVNPYKFRSGSWKCNGTVTVKIPMEYIEKAENYESLMRSGVSSRLRFNVGKKFTYMG